MNASTRQSAHALAGACARRGVRDRTGSTRQPSAGVHSNLTFSARHVAAHAVAEPPQKGLAESSAEDVEFLNENRPVRVLIAGGGIAGLVLAVALLKKGLDVRIFERDMTAIRGEGKYRGPIQVQSNALAALEAIDKDMAREIMDSGCVTGDRINGLCDGVSGDWYVKFDTYHPAVKNGLPVTRVISRLVLQNILAKYAMRIGGEDVITPDVKISGFREDTKDNKDRVWALDDKGQQYWGDILIGADGIFSKVRQQLVGDTQPTYSGYTCYTGISHFVCPDIDTVAYRVFLGNRQYFVSSDVGDGMMQWYAFHEEPAGGQDEEGQRKARLAQIFGQWNDMVTDLIAATPEGDVLRRDIYDRPPMFRWTAGRVALLGDSAHAMQPNLGQGGCMAIEDAYELGKIFVAQFDKQAKKAQAARPSPHALPYSKMLGKYQRERLLRASAIHGMARMAAIAASTYKAYLGEQFGLDKKVKIPHPGRVGGQAVMFLTMPLVLGWVLGGNTSKILPEDRPGYCALADTPHGFEEKDWRRLMDDDDELLKASRADWILVPFTQDNRNEVDGAVALEDGVRIGRAAGSDVCVDDPAVAASVSDTHASVHIEDRIHYICDREGSHGTWLNEKQLTPGKKVRLHPGDLVAFGAPKGEGRTYKIKQMHVSQRGEGLLACNNDGSPRRYEVSWRSHRATGSTPQPTDRVVA